MPIIPNPGGSVNPNQGMIAESTFQPNDLVPGQDGVKGHVPAPPTGTAASAVLRADATWGVGGTAASLVPAMAFTGSASGAAGQTLQNDYLKFYSLAQDVQLFVNRTTKLIGAPLGADFSLDNTTGTITVNVTVAANASFFVDSKVILGIGQTYYFLDEDGMSRFLAENGIDLFRTETP